MSSCDIRGPTQYLPGYRKSSSGLQVAKPSVLHRFIDQLLQRRLDALALRGGLLHQDDEHVLLAVDDEIAAGGAVPFQFAERARRRRLCNAGIGAHREAEAVAEPIARKIEIIPRDSGPSPDVIGRHLPKSLRTEILFAVERAAIEQ